MVTKLRERDCSLSKMSFGCDKALKDKTDKKKI
jgi:hypothetical protein